MLLLSLGANQLVPQWGTEAIGLGEQVLSIDKENRELKSEIERLKSGIAAAINTLRPGEAE